MHIYGTDIEKISALDEEGNTSLSKQVHISKNQIVWAVREEMAMSVEDVLARRTRTLFLNATEAKNLALQVAEIMATEMGEDQTWIENQCKQFNQLVEKYIL